MSPNLKAIPLIVLGVLLNAAAQICLKKELRLPLPGPGLHRQRPHGPRLPGRSHDAHALGGPGCHRGGRGLAGAERSGAVRNPSLIAQSSFPFPGAPSDLS